jgi:hypothetical protein
VPTPALRRNPNPNPNPNPNANPNPNPNPNPNRHLLRCPPLRCDAQVEEDLLPSSALFLHEPEALLRQPLCHHAHPRARARARAHLRQPAARVRRRIAIPRRPQQLTHGLVGRLEPCKLGERAAPHGGREAIGAVGGEHAELTHLYVSILVASLERGKRKSGQRPG